MEATTERREQADRFAVHLQIAANIPAELRPVDVRRLIDELPDGWDGVEFLAWLLERPLMDRTRAIAMEVSAELIGTPSADPDKPYVTISESLRNNPDAASLLPTVEQQNLPDEEEASLSDIWLQQDEDWGEAECGCRLVRDYEGSGGPAVIFCPLHDAATDLLKSVQLAYAFLDSLPEGWLSKTSGDVGALNDFYLLYEPTIAKATQGGAS